MIGLTELSLDMFWIAVKEEYSTFQWKAINKLLQFSTSNMREQAISYLTSTRTKARNPLLSTGNKICVCLSKVGPRIQYLCSKRQAPVSH